jgi:hypothetical protein
MSLSGAQSGSVENHFDYSKLRKMPRGCQIESIPDIYNQSNYWRRFCRRSHPAVLRQGSPGLCSRPGNDYGGTGLFCRIFEKAKDKVIYAADPEKAE